jgi:hypothetical protein|nr:hypothetical protein [Bacilli bacterium]
MKMEYNGTKVLTTKQLAKFFDADMARIYAIFYRHKEIFKEGKDYFLLTKKDIAAWSESPHLPSLKYVSLLYLWTEHGAFKFAQSFKGLRAWQGYSNCICHFCGTPEEKKLLNNLYEKLARKAAEQC